MTALTKWKEFTAAGGDLIIFTKWNEENLI